MCASNVSNGIYHKFSHSAALYTLNGKKVNVMLEYTVKGSNSDICIFVVFFSGHQLLTERSVKTDVMTQHSLVLFM